jgi:predicted nucleic acid-binding protein
VGKISQIITGQPVYLDANVFIYALEAYPEFIAAITELFSLIDSGKLYAVTSQLTLEPQLPKIERRVKELCSSHRLRSMVDFTNRCTTDN